MSESRSYEEGLKNGYHIASKYPSLLKDLHYHLYTMWARVPQEERQPLSDEIIWEFLDDRSSSKRIPDVLVIAQQLGILKKAPYSGWIPRPMA